MNRTTNVTLDYTTYDRCGGIPLFRSVDNSSFFLAVLLLFTSGFVGNIVTVCVISCWRKLHTPTYTMIACLAVSDAYSLVIMTLHYLTNILLLIFCSQYKEIMSPSAFPVKLVTFNAFAGLGRYNAGMQLCVFACLRFTAIVHPLKYKTYCTCKSVIVVSVVASAIILISCAVISTLNNVLRRIYYCAIHGSMYTLNFIVPTSIFILLHCLKLRALRRSPALRNNSSSRMNIVLLVLMSVYTISCTSTLIGNILACHMNIYSTHINFFISMSFLFNCAANPFLYFFSSPPILQFFRKMWHRLCNTCEVRGGNAQEIEMNNIPTS